MMVWGGEAANRLSVVAINIAKRMSHFQEASPDVYDWQLRMWANVTPPGGLNQPHAHPGNLWAAVRYLDMGDEVESDEDVGGAFYVEDPRFPMAAMHNTAVRMIGVDGKPQQYEVELKLERGNIVVFPAWLRHGGTSLYRQTRAHLYCDEYRCATQILVQRAVRKPQPSRALS